MIVTVKVFNAFLDSKNENGASCFDDAKNYTINIAMIVKLERIASRMIIPKSRNADKE